MVTPTDPHGHPGTFVRERVIPSGMTVKDAATQLGISRPALSNFLNGNSALSPEMAIRLQKAFGADRQQLLDMQSAYDQQDRQASEKGVAVRAFVPDFLTIKARQIEGWADSQIEARTDLPVLLRKLVQSTGNDLLNVDFPGYDNAQRKGNDGFVAASAATPWVPEGSSYWEFGTNKKPRTKADSDYSARLHSVGLTERANSTFIFVTPRNWPNKMAWEQQKNEAGDWKNVRVFDASDIEQWLEQSVPAQIWFAEKIGLPVNGYETLEQAWERWANASEPHLTPHIFAPSVKAHLHKINEWLSKPVNKPFVISADSCDEALAFLACLFDEKELHSSKDRTAIFTSKQTLRTLISSSIQFIPIVVSEDVERELVDAFHRLYCIVFRPRNTVNSDTDITLDLLSHDTFEKALVSAGVLTDQIDRLARESGCSPTIVRRRLSKNAAIRTPVWAGDDETAKTLVPMALIGAWDTDLKADRKILAYVADRKYEEVSGNVMPLLQLDDSPVWSAGRHRGVVSEIDSLYAIARMITPEDLDRFFSAAQDVFSETEPALDLPEENRWAATIYGKTRDHSDALHKGICETLVILSVHGNYLFQKLIGVDVEYRVSKLIRYLLTPLTHEKLLSNNHNLPYFAEAAPDEFLQIIEDDLNQNDPVVLDLLKPVENGLIFASPSRTGLLWAIECLAWNPSNLSRVTKILARLSGPKIDDNWANKPVASLQSIFRSWMPQTSATVEQRTKVLKSLVWNSTEVGWDICIEQIKWGSRIGHYSYRPRWRSDASGAGQVVTYTEIHDFTQEVLGILVTWPSHDETTLGDLVESLERIPEDEQAKVWDLIDEWSCNASESAKAVLRERIRLFALTRHARHHDIGETSRERAQKAYGNLQPQDPVNRHGWLFVNQWVKESANEFAQEDFDFRKRDERIEKLRREAMNDIWREYGFTGVKELLAASGAAYTIGYFAVLCTTSVEERVDFIRHCLSLDGVPRNKADLCLQGALEAIEDNSRARVLQAVAGEMSSDEHTRLFVNAPFRALTWRLLDSYGEDIRTGYWKHVFPSWGKYTRDELSELIDRLIEARRPRAAFHTVDMEFKLVETSRLTRLLRDVATVFAEPTDEFKIDKYYISEALDVLDDRAGITRDEMAELEFLFIDVLDDSEHGIPNLERMIAQSPTTFAQEVFLADMQLDGKADLPEWLIENPEQRASRALVAHRLLDQLESIPGTDENGITDPVALKRWLQEVRGLCREYGCVEFGDHRIGQLLAKAPKDEDGLWPCKAVSEAMEEVASQEIGRGFYFGARNSRGFHWRGEGGQQELDLAAKYRSWAERLQFDYPFVSMTLEYIAASYDSDASWQDSRAIIAKRIGR